MAKKDQVERAEKLQDALLDDWERILKSGDATAKDRATICRWLTHNDWSVRETDANEDLEAMVERSRSNIPRSIPTDGQPEDAE